MKTTVLSAVIAMTSFAAVAQPTLTATTNNPTAGEQFIGHNVDTTGITIGASGASATWNYGTMVANGTDTTTFSTCAATPYCDSFSGSNLASFDGADYGYLVASTASLSVIGAHSDTNFIHFLDNKDMMRYPFTYNNSYVDTSALSMGGVDVQMLDSVKADGWGTLTTPAGTFTNALRVHTVSYQDVSFMGFPLSSERTETYSWYTPGFHYARMVINVDTAGTGISHVSGVVYYTGPSSTTKVGNVTKNGPTVTIAPNPASGNAHITFSIADAKEASVTITDLTGRRVASFSNLAKGANDLSVNTDSFNAGIYVIQLHTADGVTAQKLVVTK